MTEQEVRDRMRALCPPELDPTLTPGDIDAMVAAARRTDADGFEPDGYQPWKPGTVYSLGDQVVPRERNGHVYTVTDDGTSGALDPAWPETDGGTVVDGGVTWTEAGFAPWSPTWSIRTGVAHGWRIKAGRAAHRYEFSAGTDRFAENELLRHCLEMVKQYEAGIGTSSTSLLPATVVRGAIVLGN